MAEMKTWNGYEIVDAHSREQINNLKPITNEYPYGDLAINLASSTAVDVLYRCTNPVTLISQLTTTSQLGFSVQFTTGNSILNQETSTQFMGDDCENGVFTPVAGTSYEVVVWSHPSGCKAGVVKYA